MDPHGHPSNLGNYPGLQQQHGKVPGYPGYSANPMYAQQSQLYGVPPSSMSQFAGPGYQPYQHPGIRMSGAIPSSYDMYGGNLLSSYPGSQSLDQAARWSQQQGDPYAAQMLNGISMGHPSHYPSTRTQTQPSYADPGLRQPNPLYAPNQSMNSVQNSSAQNPPRHTAPDYSRYQAAGGTVPSHSINAPRQVAPSHPLYIDRGPGGSDTSQRMMYEQSLSQTSQQQPSLAQFDTSPNRSAFSISAPTGPTRSRYEAPKPTAHQPQSSVDPTRYDLTQPTYTSLDSNKYPQYKGSFEQPHSSLRYPNPQPQSSHYPQPGGGSIVDSNRQFTGQSYGAPLSQSNPHMTVQHDPYNMQPPLSADPYRAMQIPLSQYQSSYSQASSVPSKHVYSTAPSTDSLKHLEQMMPQMPTATNQNVQPQLSHQFASPVTPVTPQPPLSLTPQPPTGCVTPQPTLVNLTPPVSMVQPKPIQAPVNERYNYSTNEAYGAPKAQPVIPYQQPPVTASSVSHSVDKLMSNEPSKLVAESISPMQTHFTISEALERLERMEEDDQDQVVINERFSLSLFPGEKASPSKQSAPEVSKIANEPTLEQQEAEKRYSDEMQEAAANLAAMADAITSQICKESNEVGMIEELKTSVPLDKTEKIEPEQQILEMSTRESAQIPQSFHTLEEPKREIENLVPSLEVTGLSHQPYRSQRGSGHPMSIESLVTSGNICTTSSGNSAISMTTASQSSQYNLSNFCQPDAEVRKSDSQTPEAYNYISPKVRSSPAPFSSSGGGFDSFQKLAEFTSREISQFAAQEAQFRPPSSHSAGISSEVAKLTENLYKESSRTSTSDSPFRPPSSHSASVTQDNSKLEAIHSIAVPGPSPSQRSRPGSRQSLPSSDTMESRAGSVPPLAVTQLPAEYHQKPVEIPRFPEGGPSEFPGQFPVPAYVSEKQKLHESALSSEHMASGTGYPSEQIPASGFAPHGVPGMGSRHNLVPSSVADQQFPPFVPEQQQFPYGSRSGQPIPPTSEPSKPVPPAAGSDHHAGNSAQLEMNLQQAGMSQSQRMPMPGQVPPGYDPHQRFPYDQQMPRMPQNMPPQTEHGLSQHNMMGQNQQGSKGPGMQEHMFQQMGLHPQHAEKLASQAQMIHHQLQQLYMMHPNPETQKKVAELEEHFANIQNQLLYAAGPPPGYHPGMMGYPPGLMGPMSSQMGMSHGYSGAQAMPQDSQFGEEDDFEGGKKKPRKRKPKDPNAPKGKPGRKKKVPDPSPDSAESNMLPMTMPGLMANMPSSMANMPSSMANMPASMANMPASMANMPASMVNMPASMANMPASMANMPASMTNMPASMANMPASMANMPASMTNMPASMANMPASMTNMPASMANMPASMANMAASMTNMPASMANMPASMPMQMPMAMQMQIPQPVANADFIHDAYHFSDSPEGIPFQDPPQEVKPKKPRKPRTPKSPKQGDVLPVNGDTTEGDTPVKKKRQYKRKSKSSEVIDEVAALPVEMPLPPVDVTEVEVPLEAVAASVDDAAEGDAEDELPLSKKREKKPRIKQTTPSKKRPSKTLLQFKKKRRKRGSDDEDDDNDDDDRSSPFPDPDDALKRRSGRTAHTDKKMYTEAEMDFEQEIQAAALPAKIPGSNDESSQAGIGPDASDKAPPRNREDDSMIVHYVLNSRMGKRELEDDEPDEEKENLEGVEEKEEEKIVKPPKTVEVEEFYIKYKHLSYLHCEWKTEDELLKVDKRIPQKIRRFKQKRAQAANMFEFLEEESFNPDYVEVDRVLDETVSTDPVTGLTVRHFLVKWRALAYEDATWELEEDVDQNKIKIFRDFNIVPPKDQLKRKVRPKPSEWKKLDDSPVYLGGNNLREYQLEGLNWLLFSWYNGRNCILADEMGLGKTIQSLTFIEAVFKYGIRGPFLVVAPLSTIPNWQREIETWTNLNVIVYHGSSVSRNMITEYELYYKDENGKKIKDAFKFHVLITTFEVIITDCVELRNFPWRLCVIDEAHRLKNKNCKLLEGLRLLNTEHRVLLSGTPLQNNISELFSLLNFLEPQQFNNSEQFLGDFGDLVTEEQVTKLQALLKPMMLRRLKEDVEKSLAPKTETIVEVELTNIQKKYYRGILERNFSFLQKGTSYQNIPNLMNTMMELRKCCIHPFLLNGAEDQIQYDMKQSREAAFDHDELYFNSLVQSSGKLVLVDKLLPKLKASGHRVLVFSQMVKCLDILEDYLIYKKYPYERIDGRITGNLRQAAIDRYSKPDSDRFVFLLCTKAGGLGINLTAADTVIIYDSDWNPQNDLQAQARCHRIGQSKTVKVYRLITRNTYEREMFDKASKKLGLDKAVLQSMNTSQTAVKLDKEALAAGISGGGGMGKLLSKKEIEDLLKKGAYGAIMDDDSAGDKFCEEDIDQILERRTQVITIESEKGSSFSKATFSSSRDRTDIDIDDPDFWKKWARKAEIDVDGKDEKLDLMISEPRKRTQIKRYGENDNAEMSELESSSKSGASDGEEMEGGLTGRAKKKLKRRSRRGDDDSSHDESTKGWAKSDCFKVEKGLLTYGWGRWGDVMQHSQFRQNFTVEDVVECSRVILLYSLQQYKGDERIKSFIMDLIAPAKDGDIDKLMRNHTGLSAPVPRGRKGKKKLGCEEEQAFFDSFSWALDGKYNGERVLCAPYQRHLIRHSNKVLLRVRMLYYIRQEVIGELADQIQKGAHASQLPIYPPPCDQPPAHWWDSKADVSLLVGTFKHGYERYAVMRSDPTLVFLGKCGPPDGADLMKEIEANSDDLDKDMDNEEDDTNDESPSETPRETPLVTPSPSPSTSVSDLEKLPWPTAADLNARLRRIVTSYQRKFKKEELRNAQKAKRSERRERIELVTRDREPEQLSLPKMAGPPIKRWSRKEEKDFFNALCTFGVDYNRSVGRYDWTRFRAVAHLEHKSDDALTEYLRAFCAMCKKVSGRKMDENEEIAQSLVESVTPVKAQRCLERLELLCKIREEVLLLPDLDARLELCQESKDTPDWWKCGTHDKDLLLAAARHGLKGTSLYYLNAPELGFREILRRLLAGEPLADKKQKVVPKLEEPASEVNGEVKPEEVVKAETGQGEEDKKDEVVEQGKECEEKKGCNDDETDRASNQTSARDPAADTAMPASEVKSEIKEEKEIKTEIQQKPEEDQELKTTAFVIDPQMLAMAATDPAAAQLLAQSLADAIGWPKDPAIVARLEHIVHAVEHGKWPVSKSFTAPEDHILEETPVQLYPPQKPSSKELEEAMEVYSFGEEQEAPSPQFGNRRRGRRTNMEYELERARLQALLQQQSIQESYLRQYSAKSHSNSVDTFMASKSEMDSSAAAASLGLPPSISVSVTTKKVETSSALDLSGPAPKKERESPIGADLTKRKTEEAGPGKKRRKLDEIVLGLSAAKSGSKTPDSFVAPALGPAPSVTITRCSGKDSRPPSKLEELDLTSVSIEPVRPKAETPIPKPRLPDAALAKLEMSTPPNDQKVSKWLADQAGLTPERPHSPDSEASMEDRRKRGKKQDPMLLDWNQLTGNETVPVINRLSGKKLVGSKAPSLRNLGQWLLANPAYDVDPNWSEIMKDKMGLSTDQGRRMTGASPASAPSPASSSNVPSNHGNKESKKRGPGRPPLHATPSTSGASSLAGLGGYPMSSLGMLDPKTLAMLDPKSLAMLDPKTLSALGMLDPKTMAMLDPKSMGMPDPKTMSMMDQKNQLAAAMDPKFQQMFSGFDPKMLAALDPKMLAALDPKMLAALDPKSAAKNQMFGGLDPKYFDPKNPLFGCLDPKSMFMPFGAAAALGQFANPLFPQYMGFDMGGAGPSTSKSGKEDKKNSGGAGSSRSGAPSVADLNSLLMSNPALLYGSLGMGALGQFGFPPGMHMSFGDMNGMQMMEEKPKDFKTKNSETPPKSASRSSVHEQAAPCGIDLSKAACSAGPSDDGAVDLSSAKSSKKNDEYS